MADAKVYLMSTRLSPESYLDHLRAEAGRLSALARRSDLNAAVPTCPGWTIEDLVAHCAEVYAHKVQILRLGRAPSPEERVEPPSGPAVLDYHDGQVTELLRELEQRGPAHEAYTWFPGESTTGFWFRRMAQEALVHRVDGELAAGDSIGPVDPVLAADGVDEVLSWFAGHPGVLAHSASRVGSAGEVYVHAGDHAFVVELPDDGHVLREVDPLDGAPDAAATISGDAGDLDLFLWGRPTSGPVAETGDHGVLERLFSRLHLAVSD
jgi:uncharacterized protein (TIGR03083 family)